MWIEIVIMNEKYVVAESQPARAVWIEIFVAYLGDWGNWVTACEGCVD